MHADGAFFIGHFANASTANLVPAATASNLWIDEIIIGDNYDVIRRLAMRRPDYESGAPGNGNFCRQRQSDFADSRSTELLCLPSEFGPHHPVLEIYRYQFSLNRLTINGRRLVVGAKWWIFLPPAAVLFFLLLRKRHHGVVRE